MCFNLFALLIHVTPWLIVAVQPWMEWISIKKTLHISYFARLLPLTINNATIQYNSVQYRSTVHIDCQLQVLCLENFFLNFPSTILNMHSLVPPWKHTYTCTYLSCFKKKKQEPISKVYINYICFNIQSIS